MEKPESPRPIRLALIGAGIFARDAHAPSLERLRDRFEIVAVCSRTLDSATSLAARFSADVAATTDLPILLDHADLEAVSIVLPSGVETFTSAPDGVQNTSSISAPSMTRTMSLREASRRRS